MIAMTLIVRDEADIVRENIEYHLAQGVDRVIAMDNGSTDGTLDILHDFRRAGVLDLDALGDVPFDKRIWGDRLVRRAVEERGARWIIANDADEFYVPVHGGTLGAMLSASSSRLLRCARSNFVGAADRLRAETWRDELVFVSTLSKSAPSMHRDPSVPMPWPFFYYRLPTKLIFRTEGFRSLEVGAHRVEVEGNPQPQPADIDIQHYPVREAREFLTSVQRFASMAERNPDQPNLSAKYQRWGAMIRAGVQPSTILAEALPDSARIARDVAAGILVRRPGVMSGTDRSR